MEGWFPSNFFRNVSDREIDRIGGFVTEVGELGFVGRNDKGNDGRAGMVLFEFSLQARCKHNKHFCEKNLPVSPTTTSQCEYQNRFAWFDPHLRSVVPVRTSSRMQIRVSQVDP